MHLVRYIRLILLKIASLNCRCCRPENRWQPWKIQRINASEQITDMCVCNWLVSHFTS